MDQRIVSAHIAAQEAWGSSEEHRRPRGPLVGVRLPPRSNAVEVFAVISEHRPGDGLVFFAGDAPKQIYACAAFKCHFRDARAGAATVTFYQIVDSEEDLALPNKSPLRAIACNIAPNNTNVDERRMFAASAVAPAVRSAFFGAGRR